MISHWRPPLDNLMKQGCQTGKNQIIGQIIRQITGWMTTDNQADNG